MSKLAIEGGKPVRTDLFAPWPCYEEDEIEAAAKTLRTGRVNYWTGDQVREFEKAFADAIGVKYAVALMNGTVALEAALMSCGICAGDEVIVTPRSYIASVSSVVTCGAKPVFADVDATSQNLTAASIKKVITPKTKAMILVHLAGWPCEMDKILALAKKHKLAVIEDCAQAQGAKYKGKAVGSFGDAATFSFCQDKIMTTGGEGGMLTTNRRDIWSKAWSLKDHGKCYDTVFSGNIKPGPAFRWLHESFGSNWRMTEMQAAIGRIQLTKLDRWLARRRQNTKILVDAFSGIDALRTCTPPDYIFHACYKCYVFLRPKRLAAGWDQARVIAAIAAEGVPCFAGSCSEIYLEKAFDTSGLRPSAPLPVARELGQTSMMFLVHPTLTKKHMQDTVRAVKKVMAVASA
ncbi:MAG: DegT/DnrJ/EryC1/StrS aminotransferase family protein [Smithellaceae bacterium]